MNTLELLKKHPKTAGVVKKWFLEKMIESLSDETVPEEFKEFVREAGIDDDKVAKMIEGNPRSLFDVLDEHDVHVIIMLALESDGAKFAYKILPRDAGKDKFDYCATRKYAESLAIEDAFKEMEEKL